MKHVHMNGIVVRRAPYTDWSGKPQVRLDIRHAHAPQSTLHLYVAPGDPLAKLDAGAKVKIVTG